MKTKKVFLLLNGEKPNKLPNMAAYDLVCATDGAYQYLKEQEISPDFISGDLDSLESFPKDIEIIQTPDQNFTDFDKILQILVQKGYLCVDVFGASGKEQDHFLGNLNTAMQWKEKLRITFYDNYGYYFLADKINSIKDCKNKTISLIPFPTATEISTIGLQYTLLKEDLTFGKRIGTRNKAIKNTIEISFKTGDLFIFIND